jgi:N-acetylglucosamine-6-phosphate deacetylase
MEILAYSTGAIDLQINGCLGLSFNNLSTTDEDKLREVCHFLFDQGVDGFLPTLVTTDIESLHRSLSVIQSVMTKETGGAEILGVHLEGPFLHPDRAGAHPGHFLLDFTPTNVQKVIGDFASIVRLITVAPELDQTGEAVSLLQKMGIKISIGHTTCNLSLAEEAKAKGINLVTHLFNAMPGLHHREPGIVGLALTSAFYCGLIGDGRHIHPQVVSLIYRLIPDRLFLVSDALHPLGLPEGEYQWDERKMTVKQGTCYLTDGTLAGTTLGICSGVANLVRWGVCSLPKAIELVTTNPSKALGLSPSHPSPLGWYKKDDDTIGWHRLKSFPGKN